MNHSPELNLPRFNIRLQKRDEDNMLYDIFRKKWVIHTPEEWVRQQLLLYLHHALGYPMQNIVVEKQIVINQLKKRFDALITGSKGRVLMLIECKKPEVELSEKTFLQASHYNSHVHAAYILISNGMRHVVCRLNKTANTLDFIDYIPQYEELNRE